MELNKLPQWFLEAEHSFDILFTDNAIDWYLDELRTKYRKSKKHKDYPYPSWEEEKVIAEREANKFMDTFTKRYVVCEEDITRFYIHGFSDIEAVKQHVNPFMSARLGQSIWLYDTQENCYIDVEPFKPKHEEYKQGTYVAY